MTAPAGRARGRRGARTPAIPETRARSTLARIDAIDALRGIAIVAMIAYHFAFDLRFFRLIQADFENDPFWLGARASIVTSFLLLVGVSLVLAARPVIAWRKYARRIGVIAACAALASAGSAIVYPQTFIYFGILHCIALSSVLALPFIARPVPAAFAGAAIVTAGLAASHPAFDPRPLSWIGFTTTKPPTQDYVPLFPWFGVVLLGIAAGHALRIARFADVLENTRFPTPLPLLGRHSLLVYMVHQPLLMGALWFVAR